MSRGASVLFLCSIAALGPECEGADRLIISRVHVVDVAQATISPVTDVEISENRIIAIGAASTESRANVQVFDGRAGYLVPGFWDMHLHLNFPGYAEQWMSPLLLAAGVTGVRDMTGDCWDEDCRADIHFMRTLQERVANGEVAGPRILSISSSLVHGPRKPDVGAPEWAAPANPAQARKLVHALRRRGIDFIKPYDTMPREAYFAMVREARSVGLPVSGHVPLSVTTLEAVQAGQISIEHAKHPLLDCSRYSGTFHEVFAAWANGDSPRIFRNWADPARGDINLGGYYQPILASFDEGSCNEVIRGVAASHAYYVPTLITRRFEARADDEAVLRDSRMSLVPERFRVEWQRDAANYAARFAASAAEKHAYIQFYDLARTLVGKAYAAGVPILVGTDSPDSYCFPGSSFHQELQELRSAGLPNAAILRAATLGAAEFLGRTADFGTVERGKIADLVVLAANPLDDIDHTRKIMAVVLNGKLFDAAAIRALEADAARFGAATPPADVGAPRPSH